MSVAGFDIGDQSTCIAVARKRGIDVLLNKESNRETPSVLSFGPKSRSMGTDAQGSVAVNPKNAVTQIKRLLGKKFSDASVQKDRTNLLFEVVAGPHDSILVAVDYLGERATFSPEQLMAMLMVDEKAIAETDGSPVTDCVIAIPAYFSAEERRAMLDASQIAGINCLRLMPETTATALAYGIYKTDLPEKDPINVVFVDVGYSCLQVAVVSFKRGQLKVLSLEWDRNLGGKDFDEVLFNHFVEEFDAKYKLDIRSNKRASFRLRLAVEKLKKVLSSIPETVLNVECLMNDVDVSSKMTRELFEQKSQSILERVKLPLQKALDASGVRKESINSVEIVGSSSRVPALLQLMREVFEKEPSRTLNAKECVSRGCALNCAMLSPIFRVRDFEVMDVYPFSVQLSWEKDGSPTTSIVFERGGTLPSTKSLTFYRTESFKLTASYTDDSPLPQGADRHIATWTVGPPPSRKTSDPAKLKVRISLNLHGLILLESVTQLEEEEYEEVVKKPAPAKVDSKKEKDKEKDKDREDTPMAEADTAAGEAASEAQEPKAEPKANGVAEPEAEATGQPMETETAPAKPVEEIKEVVRKKRTVRTPVAVQTDSVGLTGKQLSELFEKECQMALQDRVQEETSERKNALEAYIYSLRNKLADSLASYVTESEAETTRQRLDAAEDWLYDEGEDETKSIYTQKLEELLRLGSPLEQREREDRLRPPAAQALTATANHYNSLATSDHAKYSHITGEERNKVLEEASKALTWLHEKQEAQAQLAKTDVPLLTAADIKKRQDTLQRVAEPIMSRPAPPPPKEEKTEPKDEKMAEADAAAEAAPEAAEPPVDAAPASTPEPMDSSS